MPAPAAMPHPRFAPAGFTLVEILVSVTILALIATFTTLLVGGAARVTTGSRKRLDSDGQARLVFDRLNSDLDRMLRKPSVDCLFSKRDGGSTGANDTFYFCSEAAAFQDGAPAPTAKSTVALVGYRVNSRFQLERLGKGLTWDGNVSTSASGGPVYLTYPPGQATADPSTTLDGRWPKSVDAPGTSYNETGEPDAHVLADAVFRLEICFLLTDGTYSTRPVVKTNGQTNNLTATTAPTSTSDNAAGYAVGSRWYDNTAKRGYVCTVATAGAAVWQSAGLMDVNGLVVTLGLLDADSRKTAPRMTDPTNAAQQIADLRTLQTLFVDANESSLTASTAPRLPAADWLGAVNGGAFATASHLPAASAGQVRVYQRILLFSPQ